MMISRWQTRCSKGEREREIRVLERMDWKVEVDGGCWWIRQQSAR